jgi:hypothetical protein
MPQVHDPLYVWAEDLGNEAQLIEEFFVGETGYALLPMSEAWIREQQQIPDNDIVSKQVENVVEFRITEISHGDIFVSYQDGSGTMLLPLTVDELTDKICDS